MVQSKWFADGHGSFDRADMLKFTRGFKDLTTLRFERFNDKVRAKQEAVQTSFYDDQATYILVVVYTGQESLADEPRRDLDDCLDEFNDTANEDARELLEAKILRQADVHGFITRGAQGEPIDLEVAVHQWGEVARPYAVYGQVSAADIADWWTKYYPRLVAPNIRMFLGTDTEVNIGLQNTLLHAPEHFWHFNIGITVICGEIRRSMIGGPGRETGIFKCSDVSIVNGAQTAGSIAAAFAKKPDVVGGARVPARFIAVGTSESADFGPAVTRATNTQNRITRQDFAALDPEQERIRSELAVEGITYNYKSSESSGRGENAFGFEEAVVALACAHHELGMSTQAKREVGKLWEDTSKAPYKALFNGGTSSAAVWRAVQIMRMVDTGLQEQAERLEGRDKGFAIHGNRFVAHHVFRCLSVSAVNGSGAPPTPSDVAVVVSKVVEGAIAAANQLHPGAYLAQLFKNQKKLIGIAELLRVSVVATIESMQPVNP